MTHYLFKRIYFGGLLLVASLTSCTQEHALRESKLLLTLPEYCPTPDGMDIAQNGDLVLSCPNFADPRQAGTIVRISKEGELTRWFDVPPLPETSVSRPMGIQFNLSGDLYICDNQGWSGTQEGKNKGRLLKIVFNNDGGIAETITVASGMEHPNGVRVHNNKIYVTQSTLSKIKHDSGLLVSGVYCFEESDRDIVVTNTLEDKNLIATVVTRNKEVQYGLDGLVFDKKGNLYVGNFGDGAIHKIEFDSNGKVYSNAVWAKDSTQMRTIDGICMDEQGNIYVADFSDNAVAMVTPDAKVRRIAQSPDCDGSQGGLDQPGEPIVWNGNLVLSCFDVVTGPDKVNTAHDKPYTLSYIEMD